MHFVKTDADRVLATFSKIIEKCTIDGSGNSVFNMFNDTRYKEGIVVGQVM